MEKRFGCRVGLSDHSMGSTASMVAVALGACVVEKHFCLSRAIKNPDSEFSMEPQEFAEMVQGIRNVEKVRGGVSYKPGKAEESSLTFRRSIFAVKDITKGECFSKENIKVVRPGYGMQPKYYDEIIGKYAKENIKYGEPLRKELINFEK